METIVPLQPGQIELYEQMNTLFAEVFEDEESYTSRRPTREYATKLLENRSFIALLALQDGRVVGALAAYELVKFEQERSEIYLYDLAVSRDYRKKGIATRLIGGLKTIARERGAWVVFVQADTDEDDQPAIALYSKLGVKEEVLHFDITVGEERT